jgi:uncharacterized membrane protein
MAVRAQAEGSSRWADHRLGLVVILAMGLVVRLALAFFTEGSPWDLESFTRVAAALHADPTHVYDLVDQPPAYRWPYPPGYFPVLYGVSALSHATGLAFTHLFRVPGVFADLALAALVQDFLGRRGAGWPSRLTATAVIALGPTFIAVSSFNGQFDTVAILFAVLALVLWERTDAEWRGWVVGALIGAGAAVKTVPGLTLLALLPVARGWREGLRLTVAAVAVPLAVVAPWLVLDGPGKWAMVRYAGIPGLGSLTLLADPGGAASALHVGQRGFSHLVLALYENGRLILIAALAGLTALLIRYRPPAPKAAVLVWLTVAAFAITFTPGYYTWVLPFLLLAGYVRAALVLSVLLVPATVTEYWAITAKPASQPSLWQIDVLYAAPMLAAWAATIAGLVWLARRVRDEHGRSTPAQPG